MKIFNSLHQLLTLFRMRSVLLAQLTMLRAVKQHHTAREWQFEDSDPGLPDLEICAVTLIIQRKCVSQVRRLKRIRNSDF